MGWCEWCKVHFVGLSAFVSGICNKTAAMETKNYSDVLLLKSRAADFFGFCANMTKYWAAYKHIVYIYCFASMLHEQPKTLPAEF